MGATKQRVIAYIDGFNFYFGLKARNWRKYYWLDFVRFFEEQMKKHQELIEVNYFSAVPLNAEKADRQDLLFTANKLNPKFKLHLGKYLKKDIRCPHCKQSIHSFEEKETDVRIATKMITDVVQDRCDITLLLSADSDLVPPIEFIREFDPRHKIIVYFPPYRHSTNLQSICNTHKVLSGAYQIFDKALLPETMKLPNGYEITRPENWK